MLSEFLPVPRCCDHPRCDRITVAWCCFNIREHRRDVLDMVSWTEHEIDVPKKIEDDIARAGLLLLTCHASRPQYQVV